ncbi:hypothetical protein fugu_008352 [Takifugu bimaculatus]|uniref:Uncharacterized protein n=1 Tax=Takifugu bimaculatus TaxID=433685 RepID=A0A4Z2B195_9TELE|nr:hypothetical protein fugu_008352 [Takifugu bimaculatus]
MITKRLLLSLTYTIWTYFPLQLFEMHHFCLYGGSTLWKSPINFPLTGSRQKVLDGNKYMQETLVNGVCKHGGRRQHVQTHFVQMMDLAFGQTLLPIWNRLDPKSFSSTTKNTHSDKCDLKV